MASENKTTEINAEPMNAAQEQQIGWMLDAAAKNALAEYKKTNPTLTGAQRLIGLGDQFKGDLVQLVLNYGVTNDACAEWQAFYKEHFKMRRDFNRVFIPAKPGDGWRLIIIPKGMTMNKAFARCKELFKTWQYADDLDAAIPNNARTADKDYAVWVRDGIDPDQSHLGKSTRQADPDMKIGTTLLERIILELKYFSETQNHLDIKGVTFCSGSRDSDGNVPFAYWYDGKFRIYWFNLDNSNSDFGVRSAVSL